MSYKYYQISKKSDYAIKALLELALQNAPKPVNVRNLAKAQDIPVRFLEVILNELKQGGFVSSIRGKSGGYLLSESAKNINIGQVLAFLENLHGFDHPKEQNGPVVLSKLMADINTAIAEVCEGMTLKMLAENETKNKAHYVPNYSI
jgi:Rrf2 family protein